MKITFTSVIAVLLLLLATGASSVEKETEWTQRMDQLRSVLFELLPDLFSEERFYSPQNSKRIEDNVKKLADLSHDMPASPSNAAVDQDLSISLISGLLKEEALLALTHLRSGHKNYARDVLKAIPNFCIACHTRSTGLDLSGLEKELPKDLTPIERAQFLDATRQFDRALDEFEKILSNPAEGRQLEWERAARHGIAIAVRVKRDPVRANTVVNRILSSKSAPAFLRENALAWQIQLNQWRNEKPSKLTTADEILAEAKRLMAEANEVQKYPADRSADILHLRASATLHDFLRRSPDDERAGEVLLLLGICYEILQDLKVWSLHDLYYEACVQKFPHTPVARACYVRYEQSIFFGYSGSGGLFLPDEIRLHLQKLKELAEPAASM